MTDRLRIPADLDAESTELADRLKAELVKHKDPVQVSVGVKSGKVRRNSVCPCGSGVKYKKCCMARVDSGELAKIRTKGRKQQPITMRVRPRKFDHSRYSGKPPTDWISYTGTYDGTRKSYDGIPLHGERAIIKPINTKWVDVQFNDLEKFGAKTSDKLAYGWHKFPAADWKVDPVPELDEAIQEETKQDADREEWLE